MAQTLSIELAGVNSLPVVKPAATVVGGRTKRFRASFPLASQAIGDTIVLAKVPAGYTFAFGTLTADTSLGTSTVAVGVAGTAGKYKAAAVNTAVDTPAVFGTTAQITAAPLTAEEVVILTVGVAALPAAGNGVVDMFFTAPN